jgi:hypothetical protein
MFQAPRETESRYCILAEVYRFKAERASDADLADGYRHLAKGYETLARHAEQSKCPLLDMYNGVPKAG